MITQAVLTASFIWFFSPPVLSVLWPLTPVSEAWQRFSVNFFLTVSFFQKSPWCPACLGCILTLFPKTRSPTAGSCWCDASFCQQWQTDVSCCLQLPAVGWLLVLSHLRALELRTKCNCIPQREAFGSSFADTVLLSRWASAFVPNEVLSAGWLWCGILVIVVSTGKKKINQEEKQLQFFTTCFPTLLKPPSMQVVRGECKITLTAGCNRWNSGKITAEKTVCDKNVRGQMLLIHYRGSWRTWGLWRRLNVDGWSVMCSSTWCFPAPWAVGLMHPADLPCCPSHKVSMQRAEPLCWISFCAALCGVTWAK